MGGTIDKGYPKSTGGYAFEIDKAASIDILNTLNPSFTYDSITICKKDSQDLNQEDYSLLESFLRDSPHERIVITHGTDTMIDTGILINSWGFNKTVVLTGASKPAAFKDSDASCQIGSAIAACQLLNAGVFIAMHGIIKPVSKMSRDQNTGKFH